MGQKTNPIILRLGRTTSWNNKYLEKKTSELALYDFKTMEVQTFVKKFFKNYKLYVDSCKINWSYNNVVHIFISFYSKPALKYFSFSQSSSQVDYKKHDFTIYKRFDFVETIKKNKTKKPLIKVLKNKIKNALAVKNELSVSDKKVLDTSKKNFLNYFFESLFFFFNKKTKIILTIHQSNSKLIKKINNNQLKLFKKNVSKLYHYQKNDFFEEGIDTIFLNTQNMNSANLLANFVAGNLKRFKRPNFFLKFVKKCFNLFKSSKHAVFKGIKIKIKGRINRRPRAKQKTILIGKVLPILSISSKIDYAEQIAYTASGTLGVKVWICK